MIGLIYDGLKTIFGWYTEKKKAKHERDMAEIDLEKRLLLSQQEANSKWERAQLNDKDKTLRWASFLLFASPLLASLINPQYGKYVQNAWHSLPQWQANVLSGMCLAVFGIRKIPELVGSTVGAVVSAVRKPQNKGQGNAQS